MAGAELRPLAAETGLAHELAGGSRAAQRALAVIGDRRGAPRIGPAPDGVVPEAVGIPGQKRSGAPLRYFHGGCFRAIQVQTFRNRLPTL